MDLNKVLVIDDDDEILDVLKDILEDQNYTVVTAGDGNEGLKVFLSERPRLVITDLIMPSLDGIGLIKKIKEIDQIPVLCVSSGASKTMLEEADSLSVNFIFPKPFELDFFIKTVRAIMA